MEDERLYRGRFDHVGDRKLNSVRIFISSTFSGKLLWERIVRFVFSHSDTTEERNGLIECVYPRLREYCLKKYNIQFQVIWEK